MKKPESTLLSGFFDYRLWMSATSASTSSSRVAQLVQKRTAARSSSIDCQKEKAYFSPSLSRWAWVRMGNCWLVGDLWSMEMPFVSNAAASFWAKATVRRPSCS